MTATFKTRAGTRALSPPALALALGSTALLTAGAFAQSTPQPTAPAQGAQTGAQTQQQTPGQAQQQGQGTAGQQMTLQTLRNQQVMRQNGQEMGRVSNVVRGADNRPMIVIVTSAGRQVMAPIDRISMTGNRYVLGGSEAEINALPEYNAGTRNYRPVEPNERLSMGAAADASGSRITVQQTAPAIQVEQAAPQISVQQAQPNVSVTQARPEIIVRQPAPRVTVDVPQPEIIVRMPEPQVNVAQAQPQVQVLQPQPQVQVMQPPQRAQVQVERSQPQISVQRQGEPQVRYERAEPQVTINQGQGQPNVRFEQASGAGQAATAARPMRTEEQRRAFQQRFVDDPPATTGTAAARPTQTRPVQIDDLDEMAVYNARGERLGEVERIVGTADNRRFVVIAHGGFLGIGEDQVAFPIERFAMGGDDRLILRGVTVSDIEAMDNWRTQIDDHREIGGAERINIGVMQ